jgi:predicted flap endonuclease-1-like 5' DNA nuclease
VTSLLSLVAGLVVGLLAGWLLRGRQADRTPAAEVPVSAAATRPEPALVGASAPTSESSANGSSVTTSSATALPATAEPAVIPAPAPIPAAETMPEPVAEPEAVAPAAEPIAEPAPAAPIVEASLATPAAEPDDLTRIPGIGLKSAMALAASGITTYAQLATTPVPTVRAAITAAGMRPAPTLPTWPHHAGLLAGSDD